MLHSSMTAVGNGLEMLQVKKIMLCSEHCSHQDIDRLQLGKKSSEVAHIIKADCCALDGPQVKGLPYCELIAFGDQVLQVQDVARFPTLYEGHLTEQV